MHGGLEAIYVPIPEGMGKSKYERYSLKSVNQGEGRDETYM